MSVHKLHPKSHQHRFDESTKDYTKAALLNLLDGFQRIKRISDELRSEDLEYVETALNTACLYVVYSHPQSSKKRRARQLRDLQAANAVGGVQ